MLSQNFNPILNFGVNVCMVLIKVSLFKELGALQFSVPQIEYTLGGTSKMGSHVYSLLIVAMALLL